MGNGRGPSSWAGRLREVVEQPRVTAAIERARETIPRTDDAYDALTWAISRDPYGAGTKLKDSVLYVAELNGASSIGLPSVAVIYAIDESQVNVRSIRFSHGGIIIDAAMFDADLK